MANCYLSQKIEDSKDRKHCDHGFSGKTHATSAVAIFLMGLAFFPALPDQLFGTENIWIIVLAAIATAGASLVPDLDNTSSTSRNSLGPIGHIASEAFRAVSVIIQTSIRTSKDDAEPNPHRGFFHTWPSALLLGAGAFGLTTIGGEVDIPYIGHYTYGGIAALLLIFSLLHLALSGLAKPLLRSISKDKDNPFGELLTFAISFSIAFGLSTQIPEELDFWWLGVSVALGCLIHILGDAFTTAGVPLWFPFPHKGKLWWTTRFTSIKSGGVVESVIFVPFFTILIGVALTKIFFM